MNGTTNRRRGITFEQDVARFLNTTTTRNTRPGVHDDAGDVVQPGWLIECKNHARIELGVWMNTAERKALDGERVALVVKRRGTAFVGQAYVVMTLETFAGLL